MARLIDTQYQSSQPDARSALDAMCGWLVASESLAGKPTIPSANLTRAGPLLTSRPPCHPFRAEPAGRACKWGFLPRPPGISSSVPVWNGHWTWSRSEARVVQCTFQRERRHRPLPPLPLPRDWFHRHSGAEAGWLRPASSATAPVPQLPSIGPGHVCPVSRISRRERMARLTQCLTSPPHTGHVLGFAVQGSHARSCPQRVCPGA